MSDNASTGIPQRIQRKRVYLDVHDERVRAHAKHSARDGPMEHKPWSHHVWLPVLTEEIGEVARVLCENELGNEPDARAALDDEEHHDG